jgi:hypothetical protein
LTSLILNESLINIEEGAFDSCISISGNLIIPNYVKSIGKYAFKGCQGLTGIILGSRVASLGNSVFYGCQNIIGIMVNEDNQFYDSRDNCDAIIETSSNKLLCGCKNTIIPNNVKCIGTFAFENCKGLTDMVIPESVTEIEGGAFAWCDDLTSITIENSDVKIKKNAFFYCDKLTSIYWRGETWKDKALFNKAVKEKEAWV